MLKNKVWMMIGECSMWSDNVWHAMMRIAWMWNMNFFGSYYLDSDVLILTLPMWSQLLRNLAWVLIEFYLKSVHVNE